MFSLGSRNTKTTSLRPHQKPSPRALRSLALAGALVAVAPLALPSLPALAQQQNERTIEGKVVDKGGQAIKGATVFLKDEHTLAVKSYISTDDGSYRFGQLTQNTDYEIWAQNAGKKSGTKNISSFDSRPDITIILKID